MRRPESVYRNNPASPSAPPAARTTGSGRRTTGSRTPAPRRPAPERGRGFYVGLSLIILVLAAALAFELWVLSKQGRAPEPRTAEAVAPPAVTSTTIPEEVTIVAPSTDAAGVPVPAAPGLTAGIATGSAPASNATTPPVAGPLTPAAASPAAAPASTPRPAAPPSPAARIAAPRATVAPVANPVPILLAQAEQASAARRFGDAISRYDQVLKLEPQNADAAAGRLRALGDRASAGRYFLTAVTMSEGKAKGGGIPGFDGGQVVKSPCECALTYQVTPASPVQGEPYAVTIFLRNDSRKDIKPQSLAVTITVNGSASSRSVKLLTKGVSKGKTGAIGTLEDTWTVGTTSWSLDAAVAASGNTYRAQLTWELRVPAGQ